MVCVTSCACRRSLGHDGAQTHGLVEPRVGGDRLRIRKGGIDIIKDDHGLADQPYSPFDERVAHVRRGRRSRNAETGRNVLYAPCINAPAHLVISRARTRATAGAGAVLMIPGITGLDTVRDLAADPSFGLPIIAHPALLGCMLGGGSTNRVAGFSHEVLLGVLPRLAGADATVFPSFGGRFGFSVEECQAINAGARVRWATFPPFFPPRAGHDPRAHRTDA